MTCVAEERFVLSHFKAPHHNPPHFFFFFLLFSLFHFKCEVKVCVNICRASPPWRENKSLDSCLYVWFFILSLAFLSLSFERNVSQGLCTRRISLFWQSKVESNVCNELFSRSLCLFFLSLSRRLCTFLRGLSFSVLTGTAPCPFDVGLTVKDNGASWDRCHPCQ